LKLNRLLVGTLAIVLVAGLGTPAFAGVPPVETMYGGVDRQSTDPGSVVIIDQSDGSQTFLGDPTGDVGMAGLVFDASGTLFGSTVQDGQLIEIDPADGSLVGVIGTFTDESGAFIDRMTDLAYRASNDRLYGVYQGDLYSIDKTTADATLVGDLSAVSFGGGLAFAPDETLYVTSASEGAGVFQIVDPDTGATITDIGTDFGIDALGIRSDGTIFGARNNFSGFPADIYTLDPTDGTPTFVGNDERGISDIAFSPPAQAVAGEIIPIDATSLILAGLQTPAVWMISTFSALGIGAFLLTRNPWNVRNMKAILQDYLDRL